MTDYPIKDRRLEESLLGALFTAPHAIVNVRRILEPVHFGDLDNAEIYRAMLAVPNPDFDSVLSYLDQAGLTEGAGGYQRLEELRAQFGLGIDPMATAQIVREYAWRRGAVQTFEELGTLASNTKRPISDVYRAFTHRVSSMGGPLGRNTVNARDLASESIDKVNELRGKPPKKGWKTGFKHMDELFGHRFGPGIYTVLFGPTNIGKTEIACQLAAEAATQGPTLYVSLEGGTDDIWNRIISAHAEVPANAIEWGELTDEQHGEVVAANGEMGLRELEIVSDLNTAEQIEQYIADLTVRYNFRPGLVFVDNIDNLADMQGGSKRYEKLTPTSNMLLRITRRTGWGVVGLKQMHMPDTRGVKSDALHGLFYPSLFAIEGARTIAQHASFVCGMYSSDWIRAKIDGDYHEDGYPAGSVAFVKLKSRHSNSSKVTEVHLGWDDKIPRFYNVRREAVNLDDRAVYRGTKD